MTEILLRLLEGESSHLCIMMVGFEGSIKSDAESAVGQSKQSDLDFRSCNADWR